MACCRNRPGVCCGGRLIEQPHDRCCRNCCPRIGCCGARSGELAALETAQINDNVRTADPSQVSVAGNIGNGTFTGVNSIFGYARNSCRCGCGRNQ